MVGWISKHRAAPIGVDLGSRCVKLLQFDGDRRRLLEAARWDLPANCDERDPSERSSELVAALRQARQGRRFRGRDAVLCLGAPDLFIQILRLPKTGPEEFKRLVFQEAAGRMPFPISEAEIRYIETVDVRQGDSMRREVIVFAVHEPVLEQKLSILTEAGLRPVAVDAEPTALLRCYAHQFRRDEDRHQRNMFVNIGASQTAVVIAEGCKVLFIKYIDVSGRRMDEAVGENLAMDLSEAAALRRHNGDRRADQRDPEIARSLSESIRPVLDQLAQELSMCIRYHSVTFRGQPLARVVLGGGEASPSILEVLNGRLDVKCELGEPLRAYEAVVPTGRSGQWDVAAGLALHEGNPL